MSGRGIGLDAVRAALAVHGVRCRILAPEGQGSRFELHLSKAAVRFTSSEGAILMAA